MFDEIDIITLDRINSNDIREMGRCTSTILKELDRLKELNKDVIIIATTNLYSNFDKALVRRFDATIDFNRYTKDDLIEIGEHYFNLYIKNFKKVNKDIELFKKILKRSKKLPNPSELKNIIKTSLAFSNPNNPYDYLGRLYNNLTGGLNTKSDVFMKIEEHFTSDEIEILKSSITKG